MNIESRRMSIGLSLMIVLAMALATSPAFASPSPCECPDPDFDASPTSGYAPLEVQFRNHTEFRSCASGSLLDLDGLAEVLGIVAQCDWVSTWDFGDGATAVAHEPSHAYTQPGRYTVTLTYTWFCEEFAVVPSLATARSNPNEIVEISETKNLYIEVFPRKEKERDKPPEPANLAATNLYVNPTEVIPGQEVLIYADICNSGGEVGVKSATLFINGYAEQSQSAGAGPGQCATVVFRVYKGPPGTYLVNVEGMQGQFTVVAPRIVMQDVPSQQDTGIGTVGIIAIVVVGVVLIIALVLIFRKE
ncbi:PKD domain-containing protein [Chloroflexota bacterium]